MFLSAVLRLGSLRIRPGLVGLVLELELGFGLLSALVYLVPKKSNACVHFNARNADLFRIVCITGK